MKMENYAIYLGEGNEYSIRDKLKKEKIELRSTGH